jgi:hypothetical protein
MPTGTISYVASLAGARFEALIVASPHLSVEKIVLELENDEQLKITFHLIDVFTEEEAKAIANNLFPSILNRLALYRDIPIGDPYCIGSTLPKDASGSRHTVGVSLHIRCSTSVVVRLGEDAHRELVEQLEQLYTHHDLYSLYRFAIRQSDAVARFMFLYNLLLRLNHDNQIQVDDFIIAVSRGVPQSPSPYRQGVSETIFTRLRNEVGHRRAGTTPEHTRKEIDA